MKFRKGDRVVGIENYGGMGLTEVTGTVLGASNLNPAQVAVRWDPKLTPDNFGMHGHTCNNRCEDLHGWNVPETHIKKIGGEKEWVEEWQ